MQNRIRADFFVVELFYSLRQLYLPLFLLVFPNNEYRRTKISCHPSVKKQVIYGGLVRDSGQSDY